MALIVFGVPVLWRVPTFEEGRFTVCLSTSNQSPANGTDVMPALKNVLLRRNALLLLLFDSIILACISQHQHRSR